MSKHFFSLLTGLVSFGSIGFNSITLPLIGYIIFSISIVFDSINQKLKIYLPLFLVLILLTMIMVLSNSINNNPISSYLLSMLAMLALLLPFLKPSLFKKINIHDFINVVFFVSVFNSIIVMIELLFSYQNVSTDFSSYLPFIQYQSTYMIGGVYRIKALMPEPAHFGIISVFLYVSLDLILINKICCNWKLKATKNLLIFFIISTFSFSAIFLFAAYLLMKFRFNIWYLVLIFFWLIAIYFIFGEYFSFRISSMLNSVTEGGYEGSEGSRINSFLIIFMYLKEASFLQFLVGEGYANSEAWVINNFYHLKNSVLSNGMLQNTITVVVISTGVIGVFLHMLILWLIVKKYNFIGKYKFIFLIVLLHFASGYYVMYWFWYALLLGYVITYANKNKVRN